MNYNTLNDASLPNTPIGINVTDINHLISQNPSSTILASNYPIHFTESDLFSLFSHYGQVQKLQKLPNINCCMIEFYDIAIANALVQMSRCNKFTLGMFQIRLEYSLKNICITNTLGNVIVIVVSNVKYPITVDIIKQICQKFGRILRIQVGNKNISNVIECLVEFEEGFEAKAAKDSLDGEDIYSGCCSLDIKYSSIPYLTVLRNDDQSWDFTIPQSKQGILQPPQLYSTPPPSVKLQNILPPSLPLWSFTSVPPPLINPYNSPATQISQFQYPSVDQSYSHSKVSKKFKLDINSDAFKIEHGAVFMCFHVPYNVSVDHLFNIFCLYGNVNKIRFLNQPHSAMVQMGSKKSADLCIRHYNGKGVFSRELKLVTCLKLEVFIPRKIDILPNGTPGFKDFSSDPNNRFLNDLAIASNKIYDPNRTLHFFNAPCSFREHDLANMLMQSGVPKPLNVIIFNSRVDKFRKSSGLFEFQRIDDAIVALALLNHKPIIIPETNEIFHLKLTFSAREPNRVGSIKNQYKRKNLHDRDFQYQDKVKKDTLDDTVYKEKFGFVMSDDEFDSDLKVEVKELVDNELIISDDKCDAAPNVPVAHGCIISDDMCEYKDEGGCIIPGDTGNDTTAVRSDIGGVCELSRKCSLSLNTSLSSFDSIQGIKEEIFVENGEDRYLNDKKCALLTDDITNPCFGDSIVGSTNVNDVGGCVLEMSIDREVVLAVNSVDPISDVHVGFKTYESCEDSICNPSSGVGHNDCYEITSADQKSQGVGVHIVNEAVNSDLKENSVLPLEVHKNSPNDSDYVKMELCDQEEKLNGVSVCENEDISGGVLVDRYSTGSDFEDGCVECRPLEAHLSREAHGSINIEFGLVKVSDFE